MSNEIDNVGGHGDENGYSEIDYRVDRYVKKEMSETEELEFEAEYIGNIALQEKVEHASMLYEGLNENALNNEQLIDSHESSVSSFKRWLLYLLIPQTGIGIVAASVLFGLFSFYNTTAPVHLAATQIQYLSAKDYRGESDRAKNIHEILRTDNKYSLILGFRVDLDPVSVGSYEIEINDAKGGLMWRGSNLIPDVNSALYVDVSSLENGEYSYTIKKQSEIIVQQGIFKIRGD